MEPIRLALSALTLSAISIAQVPVPTPPGSSRKVIAPSQAQIQELVRNSQGLPVAVPASAQAQPGAKKPPVDAKRMQAFQQLVLDRRPSTILAAWAAPEPKGIDEDPELALPKEVGEAPKPPVAPKPPERAKDAPEPDEAEKQRIADELATAQAAYKKQMEEHNKLLAEHNQATAEYAKKKAATEAMRLKREMEILARNVTLGRWDRLPAAFEKFGKAGAKQAYALLLTKLVQAPVDASNSNLAQFAEKNRFDFDDILALIAIAPGGFEKKQATAFPPLLSLTYAEGHVFEGWLERLRHEVARPEAERRLDKRMAALFLAAQNKDVEMGEFLPTLEEAAAANDREGLNLLARHRVAEHNKDQKPELLEKAWEATLAALAIVDEEPKQPAKVEADASGEEKPAKPLDAAARAEALAEEAEAKKKAAEAKALAKAQKTESLRRAVELAPKVRDALGDAWLEESFTKRPKRGMEVIATIGGEASQGMVKRAYDTDFRLKGLQLLKSAVDALLEKAPERAEEWRNQLGILAYVWLREAQHAYRYSQAGYIGPVAQRDSFGNIYWVHYGSGYYNSSVRPLEPGQLLELRPDGKWREMLDDSVRPKFDTTIAELYLKVNEEKLAFPYIEQLAKTDAKRANELAKEFINVWIRNNDPNSSRSFVNIYSYNYGYNRRASGIPLTRSKQERNLRDLTMWIGKLRAIEGIKLDTSLLVRAFQASHSPAEVYRIETMEQVFGSLEDLDAKTLAQMAQTMRGNLAGVWRRPDVQKSAGTNRKQKDIEQEVLKGYAMAALALEGALKAHPGHWMLMTAQAAMVHDLNNFKNQLQKSSMFADMRREALGMFEAAAEAYVKALPDMRTNEETTEAFEFWFNAALGASDIPAINQDTILARKEIPKIKAALERIPGEAGERHRAKFANSLFTRLTSVNPAVKNRYLEAGFAIVGDHPQAIAARKVYDYYKDLVTEIKLVATVDGPTNVGTEPFGLRIDLRYTKLIEGESGGFGKYLQNQANAPSSYNYGRPPENYRDKFEESIRATLEENFEVKSVTFNSDDVGSKATSEFGWRRTPYAYVLLRAKNAAVDRVPALKMDLDFLDVSGYVVLPVVSPVVPIDASSAPEARPFEDVKITQILDERKSKDRVLSLEIKAEAKGLVPKLEQLVDLAPSDFEVDKIDDQGVSVSRFGDDKDSIRTERLFVATMKAKPGVEDPKSFAFAAPISSSFAVTYQRYDDADLMTAEQVVELKGTYAEPTGNNGWWLLLPIVLVVGVIIWAFNREPRTVAEAKGLQLPEDINPLTVIGLLKDIRQSGRLDGSGRVQIDKTIADIETHYFSSSNGNAPDLRQIAERWLRGA